MGISLSRERKGGAESERRGSGEEEMRPHLIYRRSGQRGRRKDARERVDGRLARVGRVDCTKRLLIYRRDRGLRYNTITSYSRGFNVQVM